MLHNKIREEQRDFAIKAEDGSRPILTARKTVGKSPNAPKGHEAFLKALENSEATVVFEKISSGERVIGTIKTSDKYTVSLMVPIMEGSSEYVTRVLFKHDIAEFFALPKSTSTETIH